MEIYEQSLPQTKSIPHCAVKFEAGEETRIVHESLHCFPIFVGLVQTSFPWRYSSFYKNIWQTAPNFAESYLWCAIKTCEVFARGRLIKSVYVQYIGIQSDTTYPEVGDANCKCAL